MIASMIKYENVVHVVHFLNMTFNNGSLIHNISLSLLVFVTAALGLNGFSFYASYVILQNLL